MYDNQRKSIAKEIVSKYVESINVPDERMRLRLEQSLFDDLRKEIINLEIITIRARLEKEEKDHKRKVGIGRIKALILEVVILAFFISLIANQVTEWFGNLKGQIPPELFNGVWTFNTIIANFFVLGGFIMLSYFNRIEQYFIGKEEKS